ncbi:ribosomal protein L7/L12 [Streptomyces sp. NPDC047108]
MPGAEKAEGFLRQERKIDAIKAFRESTGVGLREAEEAVERWERRG